MPPVRFTASPFLLLCFATSYYDTFAVAHDRVILHLPQPTRAFGTYVSVRALNTYVLGTCMNASRNIHMFIYGVCGADSHTDSLTSTHPTLWGLYILSHL